MAKEFRIKLKRSLIGTPRDQRDAVRCLGLKRINHEVVVADNSANRGQILKVQHLIEVHVEK